MCLCACLDKYNSFVEIERSSAEATALPLAN